MVLKKYKFSFCISLFDDSINLYTNCKGLYDELLKMEHYFFISNFSVSTDIADTKYVFIFEEGHCPEIVLEDNVLFYQDLWQKIVGTTRIKSLLFQFFERIRQLRSSFLLHASAVSFKNKAYVFVGEAGSGKTTIMLDACINHGAKLISNDKVVINCDSEVPYVSPGSRYINLRYSSFRLFDPQLAKRVFGIPLESNSFNVKKKVFPEEIGIEFESIIVELGSIVFVQINEFWQGPPLFYSVPEQHKPNAWLDSVRVAQAFSSLIRGASQIQMNDHGQMDSNVFMPLLDDKLSYVNRCSSINGLIKNKKIHFYKGAKAELMELIDSGFVEKI